MALIVTFLLAVGLSMDAFSLALIYGTLNLNKTIQKKAGITVGIFHFFMPIIGYQIGELILEVLKINPRILVGIIFIVLGLQMLFSLHEEEKVKILTNFLSILLFAFTVSIDSFSIGIGFGAMKNPIILPSIIFSITSGTFTYLGILFGKKLAEKFGNITTIIGAFILLFLGISYFF